MIRFGFVMYYNNYNIACHIMKISAHPVSSVVIFSKDEFVLLNVPFSLRHCRVSETIYFNSITCINNAACGCLFGFAAVSNDPQQQRQNETKNMIVLLTIRTICTANMISSTPAFRWRFMGCKHVFTLCVSLSLSVVRQTILGLCTLNEYMYLFAARETKCDRREYTNPADCVLTATTTTTTCDDRVLSFNPPNLLCHGACTCVHPIHTCVLTFFVFLGHQ